VLVERAFAGTPDGEGILKRYEVAVPPFEKACYFANYQKYDVVDPKNETWPEGGNRIQPLRVEHFRGLKCGGMQLLLQRAGGGYGVLLPVAGERTLAYFHSREDTLTLNLATFGTAAVEGDLPLLAWAWDADPYLAFRKAWLTAMSHERVGFSTRPREEKHYPEIFRYLGWCSWEQYLREIDEQTLLYAVDAIEKSGLPIRYVLVDDGHLHHEGDRLLDFAPSARFPHGWQPLLSRRRPEAIRWMGLWLNFNGYWKGICPANNLGPLNEHLASDATGKMLLPKGGKLHSAAFYDAMIGAARRAGFDFVKVDNQAGNLANYRGTAQPAACAAANAQALEAACAVHMDGLINCMAHNAVCLFNTRASAVTRCSEDYKMNNLPRARRHLHNSYGNMPWLGITVWGDHDMFHSNDPVSGQMMAVSKAMSGAPVYLSDDPAKFAPQNIKPLCYEDGELLRPLSPAFPLSDGLFMDPFADGRPYRVIAPLANRAAAVVAYNLTEPEQKVSGTFGPADYACAGMLLAPQPQRWPVPKEGLIAYDWQAGTASILGEGVDFSLPTFGHRFFLLCPIHAGWAVIGRPDKFLSPAAVRVLLCEKDRLIVEMHESGPLAVWRRAGRCRSESGSVKDLGTGLWVVETGTQSRGAIVEIVA
jgi:hypothetical protein